MDWYYKGGNDEVGPIGEADMIGLLKIGTVTLDTLVRQDGSPVWLPAGDTPLAQRFHGAGTQPTTVRVILSRSSVDVVQFDISDVPIVLGSADDCDVSIPEPSVSGHHARMSFCAGSVSVEDLGSTNGTTVSGQPVAGIHPLASGDSLALGAWDVTVSLEAPVAESLPSVPRDDVVAASPAVRPVRRTIRQRLGGALRSGRLRLSLGKELRQIGAQRKLLNQERDRILMAIGAKAQESGDAELSSTDSQVISDAWSAVQRAQVAVDNALAEAATAEGMVKDQQSRLAAIRAEDGTTVAKLKCEYDAATNEAARLRLVVSIKTTASRDVGRRIKRLQGEIASVANGKPNTLPVDVLMAEKTQLDARRLELTESPQRATSEADAANLVLKEKRTVLAQANSAAAASAASARRKLKAAVRTYRMHARAVEAAMPALQVARKLLGQAMREQSTSMGVAAEFAGRWTETDSGLSGLDDRMADTRSQIRQVAPDVRRLVAAAVVVLVCAVSITCIAGNVISENTVEAYRRAAEKGDANGQLHLGLAYANGRGVQQDDAEAVAWYRKAADQGDASSQYNLGLCYEEGKGVAKDPHQAVAWYRKAADQGYASAQYNLGLCYYTGTGVAKDRVQAVAWFRKAANQGEAPAQYNLGVGYAKGIGVAPDPVQAVAWYRKAADQGAAKAQFSLGLCYEEGKGVAKDPHQAVAWYRKAADQGEASAQDNLGLCYEEGKGVAKDPAQAAAWYRKAADQGEASAQDNLGLCYEEGKGVAKDPAQAAAWYRKAADQGDAHAQRRLDNFYFDGTVVEKDPEQTVAGSRNTADQGDAHPPAQNSEAFQVVHTMSWHKKYVDDYVEGLRRTALPSFDSRIAAAEALRRYPNVQLDAKSEFETSAEYSKRSDAMSQANSKAAQNRADFIELARLEHERQVAPRRPANDRAAEKQLQKYATLYYYYGATARGFDADGATYPPFLMPSSLLGRDANEFAELSVRVAPKAFPCKEIDLAKRIRALSDSGRLGVCIRLSDATVTINRGTKEVQRDNADVASEKLTSAAIQLAMAVIASQLNPGGPLPTPVQPMVNSTETMSGTTITVTGTDCGYCTLYDLESGARIWPLK